MRRLAAQAISAVSDVADVIALRARRSAVLAGAVGVLTLAGVFALVGTVVLAPRDGVEPQQTVLPTEPEKSDAKISGITELVGETDIPKFAQASTDGAFAEPTPINRLLDMALAPAPDVAPKIGGEPNLAGLSEIPKELIWNRSEDEEEKNGPRASFAAYSDAQEQLPWDAVEPVPFAALAPAETTAQPGRKAPASTGALPVASVSGEIGAWLKTKVTEIKAADRSRPLYHFELWLEPPAKLKSQLLGVSYDFSSPAVRPQSQSSSDSLSGFRISAAGLACADKIVVTLRFTDGHVETASVDGCKLLS